MTDIENLEPALVPVTNRAPVRPDSPTFAELGVRAETVEALAKAGITRAFAIQEYALPIAMRGTDLIGQAPTGTGKTLGFGLPMLERLLAPSEGADGTPQALVVVPTRELGLQVARDLAAAGSTRGVRVLPIYGGVAYEPQVDALKKGIEILVGTPGRLLDLAKQKQLKLHAVKTLVLDEADRMLDLGFLDDVEKILAMLPEQRQTMLFSATMPDPIVALSRRFLHHPVTIHAGHTADSGPSPLTKQVVYRTHPLNKVEMIARILQARGRGLTMIFTRTKRAADRLAEDLDFRGFAVAAVHGDLGQGARERALRAFRSGKIDVLVATDVAARGLDVSGVTHVINYDCPEDPETYTHRIGRTGRAGATGVAVTFVDWEDMPRWVLIDKTLGLSMPQPPETYHTSAALYSDLDIPTGISGTLPTADRNRVGLAAEIEEDLGGGSRRRERGRPRRGRSGDSSSPSSSYPASPSSPEDAAERPKRQRRRRRVSDDRAPSGTPESPLAESSTAVSEDAPRTRSRRRSIAESSPVDSPAPSSPAPSSPASSSPASSSPALLEPAEAGAATTRSRSRRRASAEPSTPEPIAADAAAIAPSRSETTESRLTEPATTLDPTATQAERTTRSRRRRTAAEPTTAPDSAAPAPTTESPFTEPTTALDPAATQAEPTTGGPHRATTSEPTTVLDPAATETATRSRRRVDAEPAETGPAPRTRNRRMAETPSESVTSAESGAAPATDLTSDLGAAPARNRRRTGQPPAEADSPTDTGTTTTRSRQRTGQPLAEADSPADTGTTTIRNRQRTTQSPADVEDPAESGAASTRSRQRTAQVAAGDDAASTGSRRQAVQPSAEAADQVESGAAPARGRRSALGTSPFDGPLAGEVESPAQPRTSQRAAPVIMPLFSDGGAQRAASSDAGDSGAGAAGMSGGSEAGVGTTAEA